NQFVRLVSAQADAVNTFLRVRQLVASDDDDGGEARYDIGFASRQWGVVSCRQEQRAVLRCVGSGRLKGTDESPGAPAGADRFHLKPFRGGKFVHSPVDVAVVVVVANDPSLGKELARQSEVGTHGFVGMVGVDEDDIGMQTVVGNFLQALGG